MRKIFYEELPQKIYNNKKCIDWNKSIHRKVFFEYDNVTGYFIIEDYYKDINKLKIKCNIYNISKIIRPNDFKLCKIKDVVNMIYNVSKVNKYCNIARKLNRALTKKEAQYYNVYGGGFNSGLKYLGYDNIKNLQCKNGFEKDKKTSYTYHEVYINYKDFFDKYERFPVKQDYINNKNLITKYQLMKTLNTCNLTYENFFKLVSKTNMSIDEYEYYRAIRVFKEECIKSNRIIPIHQFSEVTGHDFKWMLSKNKNIHNYKEFYISLGFKKDEDMTKDEVIDVIYKMQSKLNRPLTYDDFRNCKTLDKVGIYTINKIWGSMNNMKEELGLEIIQESMISKSIDFNEIIKEIHRVANIVFNKEHRNKIMSIDFDKYAKVKYTTIFKVCKNNNTTIYDELKKIGFELQECGKGFNYRYSDGEMVVSKYEFDFSNKLRNIGYEYNMNYFRNVNYKDIITQYDGLKNCDYLIKYNNSNIYIEIAGFLVGYEDYYKYDKKINSTIKEKYRLNLKEKEKMFKDNNLNYRILFPSDLSEGFSIVEILNGRTDECG